MKKFLSLCAALSFMATIYIGIATLLHLIFGVDAMIKIGHGSGWIALPEDTTGLLAVFVMMLVAFLVFWGLAKWSTVMKWMSTHKIMATFGILLLACGIAGGVYFLMNVDNDDLFIMVQNENTQAIETILAKGGDINAVDVERQNSTALHDAATWGSKSIVSFLLAHGANPNALDSFNRTPLMVALLYREGTEEQITQVVTDFINAKADLSLTSTEGKTAADIASEKGYTQIAKQLMSASSQK